MHFSPRLKHFLTYAPEKKAFTQYRHTVKEQRFTLPDSTFQSVFHLSLPSDISLFTALGEAALEADGSVTS